MTQHNALSVHTDIFVPFSDFILHNAVMLPALHQTQQVKANCNGACVSASTGFDWCNVDTVLHENRHGRKQHPC